MFLRSIFATIVVLSSTPFPVIETITHSQPNIRLDNTLAVARKIVLGSQHSCVITNTNGVKCWGRNEFGQLGDGTNINRTLPIDVVGLNNNVIDISIGQLHTCAILNTGPVMCWGYIHGNTQGDGTATQNREPKLVSTLSGNIKAITSGGLHTCVLSVTGGVKCWGENNYGQLGDGTGSAHKEPVDVAGLSQGVVALSSGYDHTCAMMMDNSLKCWGRNDFGQLGDGTTSHQIVPVKVNGLNTAIKSISAGGYYTCVLTLIQKMKCWGHNMWGQLGDGKTQSQTLPVDVADLSDVTEISSGGAHTCAILVTDEVLCWGDNTYGQLGDGTRINRRSPNRVIGIEGKVKSVRAGHQHTCAQTSNNGIKCWGYNQYGQLGAATTPNLGVPTNVTALSENIKTISTGYDHTCVLTTSNSVNCWGRNEFGQLGDGSTLHQHSPVSITLALPPINAIAMGKNHTCVLTNAGSVKCWGKNELGQLGDGTMVNRAAPTDVTGLSANVSAITAGDHHTCAVTNAGGVKCWGKNEFGQLGNQSTMNSAVPIDVYELSISVRSVNAGENHTCALMNDGWVKCWGRNNVGQLGDDSQTDRLRPVALSNMSNNVSAISVGGTHSCLLTNDENVKCWGNNNYGQLGDGTFENREVARDIYPLQTRVRAITAGDTHTCALLTSGLKCWGRNHLGQLGNGKNTSSNLPVDVLDITGEAAIINAGGSHTCVLIDANTPKCWGSNEFGQLGNEMAWRTIPINVAQFGSDAENERPEWLYMLYLAGDNDLSQNVKSALERLKTEIGSTAFQNPNLNIVVLSDRREAGDSERWVLRPGTAPQIEAVGEKNMADPATLKEFVTWAKQHYPAKHYYLAIADHGRATNGIAQDLQGQASTVNNNGFMSMSELRGALLELTQNGSAKLDILHLDACLMGLIEVAYDLKDITNYLIASQNPTWTVFRFSDYAKLVPAQGIVDAGVLAEKIANSYHSTREILAYVRTVTVYDLKYIEKVHIALNNLAQQLKDKEFIKTYRSQLIDASRETQRFDSIASPSAQSGCPEFGEITEHDHYLDLYDFADKLDKKVLTISITTATQQLKQNLQVGLGQAIRYQFASSGVFRDRQKAQDLSNAHGLSIYFPKSRNYLDYDPYLEHHLFEFTRQSEWDDFLSVLYDFSYGLPNPLTCVSTTQTPIYESSEGVMKPRVYLPMLGFGFGQF